MPRPILMAMAVPLILAACGAPREDVAFRSDKERACYGKAKAEITSPNTTLKRAQGGNFVFVTTVQGFVRDIDVSETFETCMAQSDIGPTVSEAQPITLTAQEQAIWNGLSDEQKRQAVIHIQQGGSLSTFVAS